MTDNKEHDLVCNAHRDSPIGEGICSCVSRANREALEEAGRNLSSFDYNFNPQAFSFYSSVFMMNHANTVFKALRLLALIESGILEDSQCGDTGKYGYWIEPEHREKIKEILGE